MRQGTIASQAARPSWWLAVLLPAAAGGMGWGIRGQYGHETGAMIAGLLVALALVLLFCPQITPRNAAKAVALAAIGISFGGAMTYGQTVGLTHNPAMVGNHSAAAWGMLGLAIKGGIWIGFGGALLGMGLSGRRYDALEVTVLWLALIACLFLGIYVLNQPFDPANRVLPRVYFSGDWYWEPDNGQLRPRFEIWGGLLAALAGLFVYLAVIKRDRLAWTLALWGVAGGAIGFPAGQFLQAFHAWNREAIAASFLGSWDPYINWWNLMEITFGAIMGASLGCGAWLSCHRIAPGDVDDPVDLSAGAEWLMIGVHALALCSWSFVDFEKFDNVADLALPMGLIPLIGVLGGRWWPWMLPFPLLALPIAGKTLRHLAYDSGQLSLLTGWVTLLVVPLLVMLVAAGLFARAARQGQPGRPLVRVALLLSTWFYFALNFAIFEFPWPWLPMTGRTPSAAVFLACAIILSLAALCYRSGSAGATEPPAR